MKCHACRDRGWTLADSDVYGLCVERCDTCNSYKSDLSVRKEAYDRIVLGLAELEKPANTYDADVIRSSIEHAVDAVRARAKLDGHDETYDPVYDIEGYILSLIVGFMHLASMYEMRLHQLNGGIGVPLAYFWELLDHGRDLYRDELNDRRHALSLSYEEMYKQLDDSVYRFRSQKGEE